MEGENLIMKNYSDIYTRTALLIIILLVISKLPKSVDVLDVLVIIMTVLLYITFEIIRESRGRETRLYETFIIAIFVGISTFRDSILFFIEKYALIPIEKNILTFLPGGDMVIIYRLLMVILIAFLLAVIVIKIINIIESIVKNKKYSNSI